MIDAQLSAYIAQLRAQGTPDATIRANLIASGWQTNLIDEALGTAPTPPPPTPSSGAAATPAVNPDNDRVLAIIAYIIFFIPLLVGKRSKFVTYHTNQGTILFIAAVGVNIVLGLIPFIGWVLMPLASIGILILAILGIVHVVNNQMVPLPLIGGFTIIHDNAETATASQPAAPTSASDTATTAPLVGDTSSSPQQPQKKSNKALIIVLIVLGVLILGWYLLSLLIATFWGATVGRFANVANTPEFQEQIDKFATGMKNLSETFPQIPSTSDSGTAGGDARSSEESRAEMNAILSQQPATSYYCTVEGDTTPMLAVSQNRARYELGLVSVVIKDDMTYTAPNMCGFAAAFSGNPNLAKACECAWITAPIKKSDTDQSYATLLWPQYAALKSSRRTEGDKSVTCSTGSPAASTFETPGKLCTQEEFDALANPEN